MKVNLKVWRQAGPKEKGAFVTYSDDDNYFEGGYNVAYNNKDNNMVFNREK